MIIPSLTDAQYLAVGKYVCAWANLEDVLGDLSIAPLKLDVSRGEGLKRTLRGYGSFEGAFKALWNTEALIPLRTEVAALFHRCKQHAQHRNSIAHRVWFSASEAEIMNFDARNGNYPFSQPTIKSVEAMRKETSTLDQEAETARSLLHQAQALISS